MQVRRTLKKLKESNEIDTNRTPSYQLVTIVKYDDYQSKAVCDNTQRTLKQHSNNTPANTQTTPNNNDNNNNNVNNDNNIRTMDIKVLKDAYLKNNKLHQLTYNKTTLNIRLFKLILRVSLWFSINLFVFKFLTP